MTREILNDVRCTPHLFLLSGRLYARPIAETETEE